MENVFHNLKATKGWDYQNQKYPKRKVRISDPKGKEQLKKWFGDGKFLDYILRDEAVFNFDISFDEAKELVELRNNSFQKWNQFKEWMDIYESESNQLPPFLKNKKKSFFREYQERLLVLKNERDNFSGLYTEKGQVPIEQLPEFYSSFKKIDLDNSIVWTGVISFSEEFANSKELFHPDKFNNQVAPQIKQMLKQNGWRKNELNSLELAWSFHTNTDNPHIHYYFYQKYPTRKSKQSNIAKFIDKYAMSKPSLTSLKFNFDNNISKDINNQNELKTNFRNTFKELKSIYNSFNLNDNLLSQSSKELFLNELKLMKQKNPSFLQKKYGILNVEERKEIDKLTYKLLDLSPKLGERYILFKKEANINAQKKFKDYINYYKSDLISEPTQSEFEMKVSRIELDDPKLELKDEDYLNYNQYLNNEYNPEREKDPYSYLRFKRVEFEQEHFISKNDEGYFQGILSSCGNEVLRMMKNTKMPSSKSFKKSNNQLYEYPQESHLFKMKKAKKDLDFLLNQVEKEFSKNISRASRTYQKIQREIEKQNRGEKYANNY